MKISDVDRFEKLAAQLDGLHRELSVLSKKSPNDAVNSFKLTLVNDILRQSNNFLGEKYQPFPSFEELAVDDLPSNSDVTFILSQYIECAEKFRADNIERVFGSWHWIVNDSEQKPLTAPPRKLGK